MALFGKSSRGSHASAQPKASARGSAAQSTQARSAAAAQQHPSQPVATGQQQRIDERIPRMQAQPGAQQAARRQARVAQPAGGMQRQGSPAAKQRVQAVPASAIADMAPATQATGSYADLAAQEGVRQKLGPVVISLRGVGKVYPAQPNRPALDNISLDIHAGEFLFLVGHSGSGKSTFIRMLNREIIPTSGELIVAGENLRTIKSWRIPYLRRNVGCVFQDFKLLPNKTAFENVAFALEVIGKSKHVIKTQVPEVLRLVGLEEKMDKMPDQLSGGEQQRVSIARSIVNRPPILICDEPTGNLDPQTSLGIMRLLERINRTGTTILVATHDREMVDQMRRRVLALENGTLVRDQKKGVYGYDV